MARLSFSDGSHYEKRGKGKPVCIDDEIPFEIPESWEWVRLATVSDVQLGKMLDKQKNQGSSKPYLANINVQWGRFDLDDVKTMLFRDDELNKFRLRPGDLMVCEGGVPGRCAIWETDEEMYYQKAIHRIRCIDELLNVRYCSLVLDLIVNSHALDSEFTGTTIKHLPARVLEQWKIPLPPYAEQLRIVSRVAELMPYIDDYGTLEDARERLDAELPDHLRKSILQLAVQGKLVSQNPADEPASALLDRIRAERAALVKAKKIKAPKGGESAIYRSSDGGYYEKRGKGEPVCIDDEIPFEIPESWAWTRLENIMVLSSGLGYKKPDLDVKSQRMIRVLRGGNISSTDDIVLQDSDVFIADQFVDSGLLLSPGQIITPAVTSLENVGKAALARTDIADTVCGGFVFFLTPMINDMDFCRYLHICVRVF